MVIGMYGGKFLPMHRGHLHCIEVAAKECDEVLVILFINGTQEREVLRARNGPEFTVENRINQVQKACSQFSNVKWVVIDVKDCIYPDGTEN